MSPTEHKQVGTWSASQVGLRIILPIAVLVPLGTFGYALLSAKWAGSEESIPRLTCRRL